jgi:hypothetical protein
MALSLCSAGLRGGGGSFRCGTILAQAKNNADPAPITKKVVMLFFKKSFLFIVSSLKASIERFQLKFLETFLEITYILS